MNAALPMARQPATLPALTAISALMTHTEDTFTAAGLALTTAMDELNGTRSTLARLRDVLDNAASARMLAGVAQADAIASDIAAAADAYLDACAQQRQSVRAVRSEVEDLDRVVRTISNVSVNARIQSGALNPPRPQVAAFIQRLATMSVEAEDVLAKVRIASAEIEDDMLLIDTQTKDLRAVLSYDLLPALARFARLGRKLHDRQGQMGAANDDMDTRTRHIAEDMSRLVVALQTGDSTRQRLDRVAEVLKTAPDAPAPVESAALALARHLFDAAKDMALAESATASDAARAVRDAATEAMNRVATAYPPLTTTGPEQEMDARLCDFAERLDRLAEGSAQVSARLATILHSESRLRQVSHQVRLSGLNAVLVCAKLGHDGRALRELAQWLRALTDESDKITARLQQTLGVARAELAQTESGRIRAIRTLLDSFRARAAALQQQVAEIETCRAETVSGCLAVSDHLDRILGAVVTGLHRFGQKMEAVTAPMLLVSIRQLILPPPDASDPATAAMLGRFRLTYTMQGERDLHDALFMPYEERSASLAGKPSRGQPLPCAPPDHDTDDVFF